MRDFVGMNPAIMDKETRGEYLEFDSAFESGNLDIAYRVSETEYNLLMRGDTNTKGHQQWFYFSC